MSETKSLFTFKGFLYQLKYELTDISKRNYQLIKSRESDTTVQTLTELPSHFKDSQVVVIDSVTSGVGREEKDLYGSVLKEILDDAEIKHDYLKTESKHTIPKFAESLDRSKNYTLLVLSGDTSIFEIVNTVQTKKLKESDGEHKGFIKIAFFPLGTGNSLAYGTGIFDEVDAIKSVFFNDYSSKLPVYKVTLPQESYDVLHGASTPVKQLYFICVISTAIHAQLVYEADKPELRKLGLERFKIAAGKVLQQPDVSYKGKALDLATGEKIVDTDSFNYVVISAVPFIEKNYLISPDSKVAKNELHLVSIVDHDHAALGTSLLLPYQNGAHIDTPNVHYNALKKGLVYRLGDEPEERSNICIDGSVIQVKNPKGKDVIVEILDDKFFEVDVISAKK